MHLTLSLTSCWRSSCIIQEERMQPHTFPPPAGTSAGPQTPGRHREPPCLPAFSSCSMRGEERWGTATEHAHSPKYTCVCLLMHIYSHHYLKITFEELWATNTTSSFIQYALNSCQRSGTWSWNTKFSYVVSESFISLLDRFSDVQLCFLYTKVQYFLHMLCKQTRRHWKQ